MKSRHSPAFLFSFTYTIFFMPYDEKLAERIRKTLASQPVLEEKKMMGGLTFMVNDKMCVGIVDNKLMCRIDPEAYDEALTRKGCIPMDFTGKPMKGFIYVTEDGIKTQKELENWINLALDFNSRAKASKKKKK